MIQSGKHIATFRSIVLSFLLVSAFASKAQPTQDSTTVLSLTEAEVRIFNDIYDGRDECYQHFLRVVKVARRWNQLYDQLNDKHKKQISLIKRYQADENKYEQIYKLGQEDIINLENRLQKAERKLNRRKALIYTLSGVVLIETIILTAIVATP